MSPEERRNWHLAALRRIGVEVAPNSRVLDYGCGDGALVDAYVAAGFDAYGADIALGRAGARFKKIPERPYRLPFNDATFDLIVSNAVLEHVRDHGVAANEMARVLASHGVMLHIVPAPLAPLEQHVRVPFAGALQRYGWLRLWAGLGIRNQFQAGMSPAAVARTNLLFLQQDTNYLSRRALRRVFAQSFATVSFREEAVVATHPRLGKLACRLAGWLPPSVDRATYGIFHGRALFCAAPVRRSTT